MYGKLLKKNTKFNIKIQIVPNLSNVSTHYLKGEEAHFPLFSSSAVRDLKEHI